MKKGQQTKELLLEAAKEEFRDVGYDNASIKGITQRMGVRPSLFSYHFNNLGTVIQIINQNFHARIWSQLKAQKILDPFIFLFAYDLLVDIATYSTPESRRFKCETASSNKISMYALKSLTHQSIEIEDSFYIDILKKYNTTLPLETLSLLRLQESAGRREMFLKYFGEDAYKSLSDDDWYNLSVSISYCTITTVFRFAGIPNEIIDNCFHEAFQIISKLDLNQFRLL